MIVLCIKEMASTDPANEDGGACKTCGYEESWCNANHWCGTWANSECGCWDCGDCIDEDAGLPCGEDQKCCDDSHTDIDRCCNNRVQNCNTSALLKCCPDEYLGNYTCDDSTMPFGCDLTCYEAEAGPDHSYDCLCPDDCDDPNDGTWCGDWTDDCGTEHSCVGNCIAGTICETYICISCEPLDCGVMCGEIYDECAQDTVFCGDCSFGQECEDNWCTTCNDHVEDCCDGYIPNCDPTYDNPQLITTKICCDETWIGDGNCDGIDQYRGCDLTCYDNGGSECGDPQGDCSDGGDCYCGCVAGESYGPGCDVIYTSDGCDLWADVTDDGWADEWVDNCLVCSECITSYDYDWANMLCCDEMFWNSSFWSDPCDDTSPRLTCTIIGMMWPEIDCSGCACPCWPPGTGYCVSGICSVSGAVC